MNINIILCGKSGSGKDWARKYLVDTLGFNPIISHTNTIVVSGFFNYQTRIRELKMIGLFYRIKFYFRIIELATIDFTELIIIDEAERLTPTSLELLRDLHDRHHVALMFIGMPGIDQRFRHYPQLYSRLGFSHRYRALAREELLFVLTCHWKRLGRTLDPEDFTDAQAIAAIERITRGNFRLLERLFPQIGRVLKINQLDTITDDVIEAAASTLITS